MDGLSLDYEELWGSGGASVAVREGCVVTVGGEGREALGSESCVTEFSDEVWPGALALGESLCDGGVLGPDVVRGLTCLELGAGLGLPGLVAACQGAKAVVLTDLGEALPRLRKSVAEVAKEHKLRNVKVAEVSWGDFGDGPATTFDVVLCCDCVYKESLIAPLLTTLRRFSKRASRARLRSRRQLVTCPGHESRDRLAQAQRA